MPELKRYSPPPHWTKAAGDSDRPAEPGAGLRNYSCIPIMKRVVALIDPVVLHQHAKALECESDGLFVADAKIVGWNSERRSKSFSTPDTVLGIEKHELTVRNAANGIQYVTLKFISLPSVDEFVKVFLNLCEIVRIFLHCFIFDLGISIYSAYE